jgi:hypothetical protein
MHFHHKFISFKVLAICLEDLGFAMHIYWYLSGVDMLSLSRDRCNKLDEFMTQIISAGNQAATNLYNTRAKLIPQIKSAATGIDLSQITPLPFLPNTRDSFKVRLPEERGRQKFTSEGFVTVTFSSIPDAFSRTVVFAQELCRVSDALVRTEKRYRKQYLFTFLRQLNTHLQHCAEHGLEVRLPVVSSAQRKVTDKDCVIGTIFQEHTVLNFPLEDALLLNSAKHAPFHICVEVVEYENGNAKDQVATSSDIEPITPHTSPSKPQLVDTPVAKDDRSGEMLDGVEREATETGRPKKSLK